MGYHCCRQPLNMLYQNASLKNQIFMVKGYINNYLLHFPASFYKLKKNKLGNSCPLTLYILATEIKTAINIIWFWIVILFWRKPGERKWWRWRWGQKGLFSDKIMLGGHPIKGRNWRSVLNGWGKKKQTTKDK